MTKSEFDRILLTAEIINGKYRLTGDLWYRAKYGDMKTFDAVSRDTLRRATTVGVTLKSYIKIVKGLET